MRKVAKQQLFSIPYNMSFNSEPFWKWWQNWCLSQNLGYFKKMQSAKKKIWMRAYQQSGLEKGLKRGWGWLSCKTLKLSLASLSIIGYAATLVCASIKPQMTAECPPFLKCYLFDCKKKRNKSDWRIVKVDLHCLKINARERLLIRFVTWLIMQSP